MCTRHRANLGAGHGPNLVRCHASSRGLLLACRVVLPPPPTPPLGPALEQELQGRLEATRQSASKGAEVHRRARQDRTAPRWVVPAVVQCRGAQCAMCGSSSLPSDQTHAPARPARGGRWPRCGCAEASPASSALYCCPTPRRAVLQVCPALYTVPQRWRLQSTAPRLLRPQCRTRWSGGCPRR